MNPIRHPQEEGPRTLLDNSMLLYGSRFIVGGQHNNDQLPIIVLGGDGGEIRGEQIRDYTGKPDRQMCRLFLSLMDKAGHKIDRFGDATSALGEI